MELKEGKRYRQRNGEIVGHLEYVDFFGEYCFYVWKLGRSWTSRGQYDLNWGASPDDLIEEVEDDTTTVP